MRIQRSDNCAKAQLQDKHYGGCRGLRWVLNYSHPEKEQGQSEAKEMAKTMEKIETAAETRDDKGFKFWTGKSPCWELSHCTNMVKAECPAFKYQFLPCWEIEGTYCKLDDYGADGKVIRCRTICHCECAGSCAEIDSSFIGI